MNKNYSIWNEMRRMQEQMDSFFEDFLDMDPFSTQRSNLITDQTGNKNNLVTSNYKKPLSDIYETNKDVIIEVEMPGLDKKDIKIDLTEDGIEIKAETNTEIKNEDKQKGIYRLERSYSGYSRFFSIPKNTNLEKAKADYKDGILKITIPKKEIIEQKRKMLEIN